MMEPAAAASLLAATEEHVRQHMLGNDASHDWSHVDRVRSLAMRLAEQEGVTDVDTLLVVELAALLHDLHDYKYGGSDQEAGTAIRGLLAEHGLPETLIQRVVDAVAAVSFHSELAASSGDAPRKLLTKEAAIVQDADRLDAIGAIGIARCITFGGARGAVLYDPDVLPRNKLSREQYVAGSGKTTTINHFHEKLLKLKGMMKTNAGMTVATQRHAYMEDFLARFEAEWRGQD